MTKHTLSRVVALALLVVALGFPLATYAQNNEYDDSHGCRSWGHLIAPGFLKKYYNQGGDESTCRSIFDNIFHNNTAPFIISMYTSERTADSATLKVFTNEKAKVSVEYGSSTSYGTTTPATDLGYRSIITLSGLGANSTYHYRVTVTDADGNSRTSSDSTFMTRTNGTTTDHTDPVVSAITFSSVSSTSATITWMTDEATTTRLSYGTSTLYGTSVDDNTLSMSHSMTLSGLTPDTTYHVRIRAADSSNNMTTVSDRTFTTLDTVAPAITNVVLSAVNGSSATVAWKTSEPASSVLYWSTTSPVDKATAPKMTDTNLATNHSMTLSSLSGSTTYYLLIEATDSDHNTTTSSQASFMTSL